MKSPAFEWKILRLTYRQQIEIGFNQKSKKQLKIETEKMLITYYNLKTFSKDSNLPVQPPVPVFLFNSLHYNNVDKLDRCTIIMHYVTP